MEEGTRENVDSILHKAGDFGRYQILLMVLFSVINVFSSFHYFGQTFISVVPEHQCNVSKERYDHLVQVTKCSKIFQRNGTLIEQPCTEGWIFNNTYGYTSIIEEIDSFSNFRDNIYVKYRRTDDQTNRQMRRPQTPSCVLLSYDS